MGKGVVMPVSASAATSGAGTPAAAKVAAGAAALDPLRRCLLRVVGGRSAGRAVMSNLRTRMAAFRRPPRPWKPARSRAAYDRRDPMAAPQHHSVRVQAIAKPTWHPRRGTAARLRVLRATGFRVTLDLGALRRSQRPPRTLAAPDHHG